MPFSGKVKLINCHNTLFYLKVLLISFSERKVSIYFFFCYETVVYSLSLPLSLLTLYFWQ